MKVKLLCALDLSEKLLIAEARNFLFNHLFARHHHGQLCVRIEDSGTAEQGGKETASPGGALSTLNWLGIDFDAEAAPEGRSLLFKRSEHLSHYRERAIRLVEQGHAYRCFCSRETLRDMTTAQKIHGQTPHYDGRCMRLSQAEREELLARKQEYQIRLRKPEVVMEVSDIVRGKLVFDPQDVADMVLLRHDGLPSFSLSNVVDCQLMGITHIMRGDRFKAFTPREAFLFQALNLAPPEYVHLPLILGEDRSLLAERHGDKYIEDYRDRGYMADSLVNYLIFHGFNPGTDDQLRTVGALTRSFKVEELARDPSVWQLDRLKLLNRLCLEKLKLEALTQLLAPFVAAGGYDIFARGESWAKDFVTAVRPSLSCLEDVKDSLEVYFAPRITPDKKGQTLLKEADARKVVEALEAAIEAVPEVSPENYRDVLDAARSSIPARGKALVLIRIALTGQEIGPEFSKLLPLLGKEILLSRLENTRRYIPKGMKRE